MRKVGFKFGRWLDVVTMQKSLELIDSHQAPGSTQ
jgi:L-amino acid N-acyltransferase YncA